MQLIWRDARRVVEKKMITKLRIVEVKKDAPAELPDNILPVRLEPVIEHAGGTIPTPSSERFRLYYLQREP